MEPHKTFFWINSVLTLMMICSCQVYNSSSGDKNAYGSSDSIPTDTPAGARLAAAISVLKANCFQCHQSTFGGYITDTAWVNSGYVVAGQPALSPLYKSLYGSNTGGREDMPQGGTLSTQDLATIRTWIENISL